MRAICLHRVQIDFGPLLRVSLHIIAAFALVRMKFRTIFGAKMRFTSSIPRSTSPRDFQIAPEFAAVRR